MSNHISEIEKLLPPPAAPVAAQGDWLAAEKKIGFAFPADFKEFIGKYGAGGIGGPVDGGFMYIDSPFATDVGSLFKQMDMALQNMRGYHAEKLIDEPRPLYPEKGGLLPFGLTQNNDYLCWRTVGSPDEWDVVVLDGDELQYHEAEGASFSKFIADLLNGSSPMIREVFPEGWLESPKYNRAEQ